MAKKKRRTPAQIRATKKLVRLAKARARKNAPKRKRPAKAARRNAPKKRPSQRNRKSKCNPKSQPKLTLAQGKRLYQLGRRSKKNPVGFKWRRGSSKVSIVTGKAARKLARRS